MRHTFLTTSLLASFALIGPALAAPGDAPVEVAAPVTTAAPAPAPAAKSARPAYQTLRFNENWSSLANAPADAKGDFFDPIKYIPLNDDGSIWLSFGGQERIRLESWNGFNFGGPAGADDDDIFLLNRLLIHADLHIGPHVRVFAQGKSALSTDRDLTGGKRTLDVDELDLQNGFVDLMFPLGDHGDITLRGGRQELLFGKQRLVSPLDWANTRRTFDGFSAILKIGDVTLTPFWTMPVPVQKYEYNDFDSDTQFFGVYGNMALKPIQGGVDLYYMGLLRDTAVGATVYNGTVGDEERHTLGGRIYGKIDTFEKQALDYDVEAAYQLGDVGGADINAWMLGSQVGYKFAGVDMQPRLWAGLDYASGDDGAGGSVQTFNQLYPLGHAYLGWIDQIGRQNIMDLSTGLSLAPMKKLSVDMSGHFFWRADDSDGLYNAGGVRYRAPGTGLSREVGAEFDLLVKYQLETHTEIYLGYSHFFPGAFVKQSGPSRDIDFLYLILQYTF